MTQAAPATLNPKRITAGTAQRHQREADGAAHKEPRLQQATEPAYLTHTAFLTALTDKRPPEALQSR